MCWSLEKLAPESHSGTFQEGVLPTSERRGAGKGRRDEVLNVPWGLAPAKAFQRHHLDAGQMSGCTEAFPWGIGCILSEVCPKVTESA